MTAKAFTEMIGEVKNEVKSDFLIVFGLVAALGQLAFLGKLFSYSTDTKTIYAASLLLFCLMTYLSKRYLRKVKSSLRYPRKRKVYRLLTLLYALLAVIALIPAGYRWGYINTDWIPSDKRPGEIEIGRLFSGTVGKVLAASQQQSLRVTMYLDPLRTSLRCSKARSQQTSPEEIFSIDECREYSITGERLQQIMWGHNIGEDDPRKADFEHEHFQSIILPTFQALKIITDYRNKPEPLLERGSTIVFLFAQKPSWKTKLLAVNALPNADEWKQLEKDHPDKARALRKFLCEWIGLLDPVFHISLQNTTSEQMEVAKIKYTAKPRRGAVKADLIGAYDTPRYLVELKQGAHEEEFHPPIQVLPNSVKEIDLLVRLRKVDPGVKYDISLEFLSRNPEARAVLPTFAVTFLRGDGR